MGGRRASPRSAFQATWANAPPGLFAHVGSTASQSHGRAQSISTISMLNNAGQRPIRALRTPRLNIGPWFWLGHIPRGEEHFRDWHPKQRRPASFLAFSHADFTASQGHGKAESISALAVLDNAGQRPIRVLRSLALLRANFVAS